MVAAHSGSTDVFSSGSAATAGLQSIAENGGVPDLVADGQTRVVYGFAYDAGTEINTEDYQDLVPPCDGLGQTGMSNPAPAENGVVLSHPGIQGGASLNPAVHGWTGAVIKVKIEEVGGSGQSGQSGQEQQGSSEN